MLDFHLSRHAAMRADHRGVKDRLTGALVRHADIDAPAGRGCRLLRMSWGALQDRSLRDELGADVDRLTRLAVIWNDETSTVVTVFRIHAGPSGKRYRRLH